MTTQYSRRAVGISAPARLAFVVALGLCVTVILSVIFGSYFTVSQNQEAVVTRWGQISSVAGPGLHFKAPFIDDVHQYRTDIQELSPGTLDGRRARVNTYTIDNQEVDVDFTVFYRIPPGKVAFVFTNNRDYSQRLFSVTVDRLKVEMGKVNVQSVAERRGELRDAIKKIVAHDALTLGLEVTDIQLADLQYTDSFRSAVNAAAVQKAGIETIEYQRQQALKTAEMVKISAEGQANAVREKAHGDADARLLQAQAEAKATKLDGEAKADAIRAQADALKENPSLVNLRRVERWNGTLPQNMYANVPLPFLSLDAKQ